MDQVNLRIPQQKKRKLMCMTEVYKNLGGNSSVRAYEILPTAIRVQFNNGSWYSYSYLKAGRMHVDQMKQLARNGVGLCSYIQRCAKYLYD